MDWKDSPEKHPVAAAVLSAVGSGKRGKDIRAAFEVSPYGWPRDAVDAALITLHTTSHLRATHKGITLSPGQLDQAKVSVTDFRAETVTLRAREKMKLRKLFHAAGVDCKPGEEALKAGDFLTCLAELAIRVGGEPPLPPRPGTDHLDALCGLAGTEQLAEILNRHATLEHYAKEWATLAARADSRKGAWDTLSALLQHAEGVAAAKESRRQANAVRTDRRLLDVSDPLPDIRKGVVDALRTSVTAAYAGYAKAYRDEMTRLTSNEHWKQLAVDQRSTVLGDEGIDRLMPLSIGSESDLLRSLEQTALPAWKTKSDALLQQFARAGVAAATLLEPKTQRVHLTSGTLKTHSEVASWVADTEQELLATLESGPIVIS